MAARRLSYKKERKMDVRKERVGELGEVRISAKEVLWWILSAAWGFLAGVTVLPLGASPFGFAALGASSRYVACVAIGAFGSCFLREDGYVCFFAYLVLLILRAAFSLISVRVERNGEKVFLLRGFFSEHLYLRAVSSAAGALVLGGYGFFAGGRLYYHLASALISALAAAVLTLIWDAVTPKRSHEKCRERSLRRTAALCALAAFITYSVGGIYAYGVFLPVLAAMLLTLAATRVGGVSFGVLVAMCVGVVTSVTYAPLFIFSAVLFSLLRRVSLGLASLATLGVGMAWGIYMRGLEAFSVLFGALLMASVTFPVIDRLFLTPRVTATSVKEKGTAAVKAGSHARADERYGEVAVDVALARLDDTARGIKELCRAFSSLSERLLRSEEKYREDTYPAHTSQFCGGSVIARITDDRADVTRRTPHKDARRERAETREQVVDAPSVSVREVRSFAAGLGIISDHLAEIMRRTQDEYYVDASLSEALTGVLLEEISGVELWACVIGRDKRRIFVSGADERTLSALSEHIARVLGRELGIRVAFSDVLELRGTARACFFACPPLTAQASGRARRAPDEDSFCGDSFDVSENTWDGKLYAFISDGMGSGRAAARTSEICAAFLSELPTSGVSATGTLELLNGFLREYNCTSGSECATSADLAEIDLVRAVATFYKSGAAPTYLFRDGELFKFCARTVPIGILSEVDRSVTSIDLLPGDAIVMVSDGVTEGREECPELFEFIRARLLTHSASELAEAIMKYTERQGSRDDASAVVIKIDESLNL